MKLFTLLLLAVSFMGYSQNSEQKTQGFKGDHFVLYNKCLSAIIFCESTQQNYNFCTAYNNCYGLYVMPGDTFYVNLEDNIQQQIISADISFSGYFPAMTQVVFQPVNNSLQCIPPQALQIVIPLTATLGSSFQIQAQNPVYVGNTATTPTTPLPMTIQIGGFNSQLTTSLSDFTLCPIPDVEDTSQVAVHEIGLIKNSISISQNPTAGNLKIEIGDFKKQIDYIVLDIQGNLIDHGILYASSNEVQLHTISSGLYFISFYSEGYLIETKKIIISK